MIIWNEIDTVMLDMDGTLLDLHFDNYFWQEYLPLRYFPSLTATTSRLTVLSAPIPTGWCNGLCGKSKLPSQIWP